jgi:hypothetical protein
MRMRLRTAALLTIAGALTAGSVTPALAAPPEVATWNADLGAGEATGIDVAAGSARLDPATAFVAPVDDGGLAEGAQSVPTGLLTLPERRLGAITDRVDSAVRGDVPAGTTASVDVRGMRASGNWTEWIPSTPTTEGGSTTLPEATSEVQARLVLTGEGAAMPTVRGVTLTARPASRGAEGTADATAGAEAAPLNFRVFATREGLAGSTTANGHVIADRDHFVALPSRRALSPKDTSDYSVKVCAPTGKCAFAPVWDVGPWNTKDDYWNPPAQRQSFTDLPQGTPEAQAAHDTGYNGGNDGFGRKVANPAGIDLGDGIFWDALGLTDNSYVTVAYLWTGDVRLSKVVGNDPVNVLAAPNAGAKVVGVAVEGAAVPVQCELSTGGSSWLQIGIGQFVTAAAVPQAGQVGPCATTAAAPVATPTAGTTTTAPETPGPTSGTAPTSSAATSATTTTASATIPAREAAKPTGAAG